MWAHIYKNTKIHTLYIISLYKIVYLWRKRKLGYISSKMFFLFLLCKASHENEQDWCNYENALGVKYCKEQLEITPVGLLEFSELREVQLSGAKALTTTSG